MATLSTALTITSTTTSTDALSITVSDSLTTGNPSVNIARASIGTSAVTNILTTDTSAISYVYLKNMDGTNIITVKTDGGTAFPLKGATGLEVQANTAACILEYGYWAKG